MESFPSFHDPTKFPAFSSLPLATSNANAIPDFAHDNKSDDLSSPHHLLGTISENMTLGANPTFICKDRDTCPFAVMIKIDSGSREVIDPKAFKKGYAMVIRDARRYGVREGKQGFVETTMQMIQIIPAQVDTLIGLSSAKDSISKENKKHPNMMRCQACSAEKDTPDLSRCKGCESVWYCDKVRDLNEIEIDDANMESDVSDDRLE